MSVLPLPTAPIAGVTLALLALSGCASKSAPTASTRPGSAAVSPSASAVPTAPAPAPATTAPATPSRPATPTTAPRTSAGLKKALLSIEDLPPGFEVDPSGSGGGKDDGRVSSSRPACAPLVTILQEQVPASSLAHAGTSFSGGQDGPAIDQSLDSFSSRAAAASFIAGYRRAVQACSEVQLQVFGVGRSTVSVRPVSFGSAGDSLFAARLTAPPGPLQGLEVLQVGAQSGDVVVGMSFMSTDPSDAQSATEDAVSKVDKVLGTGGTPS